MARGDHIKVCRGIYDHHGIDLGNGAVIHYTGEVASKSNASVKKDTINTFSLGSRVEIVKYGKCFPVEEVINRAESKLGERGYSLFFSNCEHFACWCKSGIIKSEQITDKVSTGFGIGISTAATGGGIAAVSGLGTVAGLSGSGVMSGLASVGSYVGAGAVGGVAALAAAPAAVTTLAMRKILADDESLPSNERDSRKAGRVATTLGAAGGVGSSVAAISIAGKVAGLSGAGITSGLAAIGSTAGGGMVAGTAIAVAAPAVAAAAVGYGVYKIWKWFSD